MATLTSNDTTNVVPKFLVLEKSLIGNRVCEPGEIVELPAGTLPAENLEPQCDIGRALRQEYLDSNAARIAKMKAENAETALPANFTAEMAKASAASHAELATAISTGIAAALQGMLASGAIKPGKAPKAADTGDIA